MAEGNDLTPALHGRPLLGQDKFAASKVFARFREQDRELKRKRELPVKILMKTVEIALSILQQQRSRLCLAVIVAGFEKIGASSAVDCNRKTDSGKLMVTQSRPA